MLLKINFTDGSYFLHEDIDKVEESFQTLDIYKNNEFEESFPYEIIEKITLEVK